ncbi:MAG: hypothetical protein PHU69_13285 [Fermentimonas sp.]|nr:hypothetical protein [Fermentimonas sp.]
MNLTYDPVTLTRFEFEDILIYAERYAIGRMTYAPHDVCKIINTRLHDLTDNTLKVLRDDIARAIEGGNLGSPSIDAPVWRQTYANITEEISKRSIK